MTKDVNISTNQPTPSLLDFLVNEGVVKETKSKTLREYDEPTIEFYKSGQARLRGIEGDKVSHLLYKVNDNGIELFSCGSSEEVKEINKTLASRKLETMRVCETSSGDPNIRVGKKATDFFNYIKQHKPQNCQENRAGSVAWDKLEVEETPTGNQNFKWNKNTNQDESQE